MFKLITISLAACLLAGPAQAQTMHTPSATGDHAKMNRAAHLAAMGAAQRQAEVSRRGPDVMPFELAATTHVFTGNASAGVQQVVAKK